MKNLKSYEDLNEAESDLYKGGKVKLNIKDRDLSVNLQKRNRKSASGEEWDVWITNTTNPVLRMTPSEFKAFAKQISEIAKKL